MLPIMTAVQVSLCYHLNTARREHSRRTYGTLHHAPNCQPCGIQRHLFDFWFRRIARNLGYTKNRKQDTHNTTGEQKQNSDLLVLGHLQAPGEVYRKRHDYARSQPLLCTSVDGTYSLYLCSCPRRTSSTSSSAAHYEKQHHCSLHSRIQKSFRTIGSKGHS